MGGMQRPEGGWRFDYNGININDTPDGLQPNEYPYSQNIRQYRDNSLETRPGYSLLFSGDGSPFTDVRAYSAINTDNLPRFLARNSNNRIYLDNGALVTTLNGTTQGVAMIPYRPSQSPQSWMYVGSDGDYKKLSAPMNNVVTVYNAGIKEQQAPPEICPEAFNFYEFSGVAADWTQGGTAGALSNQVRLTDVLGSVLEDPTSGTVKRCSCQVATTKQYQTGMSVVVDSAGVPIHAVVQEVLPPVNAGTTITIDSIYYYTGTTGRCVIVPTQQASSPSVPIVTDGDPAAQSIYSASIISSLRRGCIVRLNNGVDPAENLFVLSVTTGPSGTICFEVVTAAHYAATNAITGIPAVIISGVTAASTGKSIEAASIQSSLTGTGTGTVSRALATNPFIQALAPSTSTPQDADYVGISVNISDLSKLIRGTVYFNIEPGAPAYNVNALWAQFDSSNLVFHTPAPPLITEEIITRQEVDFEGNIIEVQEIVTSTTPLPASQWTTVMFPISSLTRLGNDLSKTLSDCNGVRISIDASDSLVLQYGSLWLGGGGQPDVGFNGSPYFYSVVGRNAQTGAESNPSPMSRYGVSPRRQKNRIVAIDNSGDAQLNTWDIFRFGGSINSWRYVGSMPNTGGGSDIFTDNYFDTAALAGSLMERDNLQPWPSIDVPFNLVAGVLAGVTTAISVVGTTVVITAASAVAFANPFPSNITKWLPGTLVRIGGQNAYTLWARPTAVVVTPAPGAVYYAYLLQFVENVGSGSFTTLDVLEPNIANQNLPYLWGPDASGTIFAAGDPLRGGNIYFCKSFSPDSAPGTNNTEVSAPTEPILGGEVIHGLSMAASSKRWWALYPQAGAVNRYQAVERPVGRGLAGPYGHCTDGKHIWFWAKDGIWVTIGEEGKSLTDDFLFNLFPHEGVNTPVNYTYAGNTIYAPDYKYSSQFRLAYGNGYLYADYLDSTGTARTLVCDYTDPEKPKWIVDVYGDLMRLHYAVEQQESTLQSSNTLYPLLIMGGNSGKIYKQASASNDNGQTIPCVVSTFEYNGGDIRSDQLFNDAYVDITPISGMVLQPISDGANVGVARFITASPSRLQTNTPVGVELKFMGIRLSWTDDYNSQAVASLIHAWQPMYQGVPVSVFAWKTQVTSFGWMAYGHLRQWNFSYRSTADVNIVVTAYDGTSPAPIVLPSTGGVVRKTMFPFTFNKGMLYQFIGTSQEEWTPYLSESQLYCGAWGRTEPYQLIHDIDGPVGIKS